jgi:hypothetical protein
MIAEWARLLQMKLNGQGQYPSDASSIVVPYRRQARRV